MLQKYPGAPATKDALIILIESYNKLEMIDLAKSTADVLTKNFTNYSYTLNENKKVIIEDSTKNNVTEKESFFDLGLF
jgi:outer membrane protein assembly factor BamD (BamD/ComL family)